MAIPNVVFRGVRGPDATNTELGTLSWDGSRIVADPANDPLLHSVLDEPIYAPSGGEMKELTAADGEAFLRGLPHYYRSAYMYAALEGGDSTDGEPDASYVGPASQ